MNRRLSTMLLGLPAALGLGVGALVGHGATAPANPVDLKGAIAVFNWSAAWQAFPAKIAFEEEFQQLQAQLRRELDQLRNEVLACEANLATVQEGTDDHEDLLLEHQAAADKFERVRRSHERKHGRQFEERGREVTLELREQVREFAKARGYQMIMRRNTDTMVYAADALDVTVGLVQFLKAGAPGGAGAAVETSGKGDNGGGNK